MLQQTDTPETVRLSDSINDEEIKYVTVRKTLIKEWLNSLDIYCELEDVPNIALLGSGGGDRAAVSMLGSLHQLEQDNLLGSLLYMCGVSGTTWCMSSLYSDPDWSLNKRCDEVIKKMTGPTMDLKKAVDWLIMRKDSDQDFSLTDFWGVFTACYFMNEMDTRCLSDDAHRDSINPYPIYSAIELDCYRQDDTKAVWFEMTPHESGFSGLGAFVPTSCLGSRFKGGTLIEKSMEMDMVLLQGICGSAIADTKGNIAEVANKIWGLFEGHESMMLKENMNMVERSGKVKVCECVPSRVVRFVFELIKYAEDPDPLKTWKVITTLRQLLEGLVSSKGEMLWNMDPESWKRTSLVERKKFIETVSLELILSSDSWAKDWKDQRCNCNDSIFWIVLIFFHLLIEWKWGTTSNFLFEIKDARVPESMRLKEKIHLVDAALKINSPYPPVLRTSRKVDLIISLDFSEEDPFETVFSAKQYADELKLPFPPVNDDIRKEKDHPQDCYVFEGQHTPTIMHMPLFNLQNCHDEDEIKKEREKYKTFQLHYGAPEIDHLLKKAQANMRNNRDRILEQIIMAIQRRKKRMSVAQ
ncbi:cytosolic phospholipase A2 zeta-like [Oncorhynchus keta]|uniref:cytosolic phospholipase A2 zeta-like n=1 Tax=Oncorhynchus keta TaxID=8018 RepID=UPI0015FD7CCD|nr:cytosolic phospholipase A2 zeta-like [Oncorhynchus keta]